MSKKVNIITVEINEELNTAYVKYESGTEKMYCMDKLPKTVQVWIEKHPKQEIKEQQEEKQQEAENYYLAGYEDETETIHVEVVKADSLKDAAEWYNNHYNWSTAREATRGEIAESKAKEIPIARIESVEQVAVKQPATEAAEITGGKTTTSLVEKATILRPIFADIACVAFTFGVAILILTVQGLSLAAVDIGRFLFRVIAATGKYLWQHRREITATAVSIALFLVGLTIWGVEEIVKAIAIFEFRINVAFA